MNQSELRLKKERQAKLRHLLYGSLNVDAIETEGREPLEFQVPRCYPRLLEGARCSASGQVRMTQPCPAFLEIVPVVIPGGGDTLPYLPQMSNFLERAFLDHRKESPSFICEWTQRLCCGERAWARAAARWWYFYRGYNGGRVRGLGPRGMMVALLWKTMISKSFSLLSLMLLGRG